MLTATRLHNTMNTMIHFINQSLTSGSGLLAAALFAAVLVHPSAAQSGTGSQADRDSIVAAALNYAEGWYEGNESRMQEALHPELAKRAVFPTQSGGQRLSQMSAMTLVTSTARGGGKDTPLDRQLKEVTIFEIYGDVATAKVVMSNWTDYLHLAKWQGEWKIVNVLWELTPESKARMARN
jgi:hypothetical protein